MANEFKDVLRVEAGGATGISTILRNKQTGYENDGTYRQGHKRADGTMNYWSPDGYIFATGVQYVYTAQPSVSNVENALDLIFDSITGLSATGSAGAMGLTGAQGHTGAQGYTGAKGYTGVSESYIPHGAADGILINSAAYETGSQLTYVGNQLNVVRVNAGGGYAPAILKLKRDSSNPQKDEYVGRIEFEDNSKVSGLPMPYAVIEAFIEDPNAGGGYEKGRLDIGVGDTSGYSRVMTLSLAGSQAVNYPLYVSNTVMDLTAAKCEAYGIPTGAQGIGSSEPGAMGMLNGRDFSDGVGGLKIKGITQNVYGTGLDFEAYNEGESGEDGSILFNAAQYDGAGGLTGYEPGTTLTSFRSDSNLAMKLTTDGNLTVPGTVSCTGLQVNSNALNYSKGSDYYGLNGCTGAGCTGVLNWNRVDDHITVTFLYKVAYSNSTALSLTVPTFLLPGGSTPDDVQSFFAVGYNNSNVVNCKLQIHPSSATSWSFNQLDGSAYTDNTSNKGITKTTITYYKPW